MRRLNQKVMVFHSLCFWITCIEQMSNTSTYCDLESMSCYYVCPQYVSDCTSATFYSVSISKPIPVWFGKKIKILTTCFPNQFQFGLEKNYNFDDSFSKPIPVWFGKNDHFSEAKNSKLIPHFFGKTLKSIYFFPFSKFEIIFCFKMSRN